MVSSASLSRERRGFHKARSFVSHTATVVRPQIPTRVLTSCLIWEDYNHRSGPDPTWTAHRLCCRRRPLMHASPLNFRESSFLLHGGWDSLPSTSFLFSQVISNNLGKWFYNVCFPAVMHFIKPSPSLCCPSSYYQPVTIVVPGSCGEVALISFAKLFWTDAFTPPLHQVEVLL